MKKIHVISLAVLISMALGAGILIMQNSKPIQVSHAVGETDMDDVAVESGEQLDKDNMIYDDFSDGIDTTRWVMSKKAWGNSNTSYNSGVIPENVFYNSTDKTVVFRALGDYYKDNDVNYDLHSRYGYAHDGSTGDGRVYSKDGTRTGGCIKTRESFAPGRFEAKFKVAPVEGVCTAFWTFNYGDSGETNYNEMDFELPTYLSDDAKDDLYFNRIICTTYKSEGNYKSQRVTNPVYLNDNQFHTYCLDWYYSNNTKKVNWFIDGNLIASWNNVNQISNDIGRVTLGAWIPGRSNFCGIPNFDKAYMELDYFKYTPFKNQTYLDVDTDELKDFTTTYTTITSTPENDFVPQGSFNYGMPSFYTTNGDVVANKSYNHSGSNSYGVKLAGNNGAGISYFEYTNPNIRGITKLKLSMAYKGYGSLTVKAGSTQILDSGTLASPSEWSTYETELNIPNLEKTLTIRVLSESNDVGFIVDGLSVTYPDQSVTPPFGNNDKSYSFYTKNNGQTTDNSSVERQLYPDLNNEHLWQLPGSKYATGSKDTVNTIFFKPTTDVMSSTSGSVYYPVKTCLQDNSLFTSSDKVAAAIMLFDIDNFSDIEVSLYSYSGVSARKLYYLYSLDSGASWSLLKTINCNGLTDAGAPFRYNSSARATSALQGKTIRFALIGNMGTGSGTTDAYRLASVVINNYVNFKAKLDGSTCSLDSDSQDLLAYQYANLTSNELTSLQNETMANYNQSYAYGYNYLLAYWNTSSGNPSRFLTAIKENTALYAVLFFLIPSPLCLLFIFRRKRRINQ